MRNPTTGLRIFCFLNTEATATTNNISAETPAVKGGSGSGNWAHAGRPGIRGGSARGTGGLAFLGLGVRSSPEARKHTAKLARKMKAEQAAIRKTEMEFWAGMDEGGLSPLDRIRPTDRAPRGQGKEYAYRRKISDRVDSFKGQRMKLQKILDNDRGTAVDRRRKANAKIRMGLIDETLEMVEAVAGGLLDAGIPLSESRDVLDDILSYTAGMYASGER